MVVLELVIDSRPNEIWCATLPCFWPFTFVGVTSTPRPPEATAPVGRRSASLHHSWPLWVGSGCSLTQRIGPLSNR